MSRQCKCKKGYCSKLDLKCSHCRTAQEQKEFLQFHSCPTAPFVQKAIKRFLAAQDAYIEAVVPKGFGKGERLTPWHPTRVELSEARSCLKAILEYEDLRL